MVYNRFLERNNVIYGGLLTTDEDIEYKKLEKDVENISNAFLKPGSSGTLSDLYLTDKRLVLYRNPKRDDKETFNVFDKFLDKSIKNFRDKKETFPVRVSRFTWDVDDIIDTYNDDFFNDKFRNDYAIIKRFLELDDKKVMINLDYGIPSDEDNLFDQIHEYNGIIDRIYKDDIDISNAEVDKLEEYISKAFKFDELRCFYINELYKHLRDQSDKLNDLGEPLIEACLKYLQTYCDKIIIEPQMNPIQLVQGNEFQVKQFNDLNKLTSFKHIRSYKGIDNYKYIRMLKDCINNVFSFFILDIVEPAYKDSLRLFTNNKIYAYKEKEGRGSKGLTTIDINVNNNRKDQFINSVLIKIVYNLKVLSFNGIFSNKINEFYDCFRVVALEDRSQFIDDLTHIRDENKRQLFLNDLIIIRDIMNISRNDATMANYLLGLINFDNIDDYLDIEEDIDEEVIILPEEYI